MRLSKVNEATGFKSSFIEKGWDNRIQKKDL